MCWIFSRILRMRLCCLLGWKDSDIYHLDLNSLRPETAVFYLSLLLLFDFIFEMFGVFICAAESSKSVSTAKSLCESRSSTRLSSGE